MVLYCSETMRSVIETKTHYIYLRNAVRSRECNWVKRGCSVDESLSETTLRPPQAFTKVTSHILRLFNSNFWWFSLNINWRKNTRPTPPKTRENERQRQNQGQDLQLSVSWKERAFPVFLRKASLWARLMLKKGWIHCSCWLNVSLLCNTEFNQAIVIIIKACLSVLVDPFDDDECNDDYDELGEQGLVTLWASPEATIVVVASLWTVQPISSTIIIVGTGGKIKFKDISIVYGRRYEEEDKLKLEQNFPLIWQLVGSDNYLVKEPQHL